MPMERVPTIMICEAADVNKPVTGRGKRKGGGSASLKKRHAVHEVKINLLLFIHVLQVMILIGTHFLPL